MLAVVAGIVASSIGGRNGSAEQLGKAWKMRARLQFEQRRGRELGHEGWALSEWELNVLGLLREDGPESCTFLITSSAADC